MQPCSPTFGLSLALGGSNALNVSDAWEGPPKPMKARQGSLGWDEALVLLSVPLAPRSLQIGLVTADTERKLGFLAFGNLPPTNQKAPSPYPFLPVLFLAF